MYPDGPDGRELVSRYEYDSSTRDRVIQEGDNIPVYRMIKSIDSANRETIISYDGTKVGRVEDEKGFGQTFKYHKEDDEVVFVSVSDNGLEKRVSYKNSGRPHTVAVNGRLVRTYLESDTSYELVDEKGNITKKEIDQFENITKFTFADGSSIETKYDAELNKPIWSKDQVGVISTFTYDDNGNLLTRTNAVGTSSEQKMLFTWDDNGQMLTSTVDGDDVTQASTTTYTYDSYGNVATITDAEGALTQYTEYDSSGALLEMIDARGGTWSYTYDDLGRLTSETNPLNRTTSYEYDDANNPSKVTDPLGRETAFTYDIHNRPISTTDALGSQSHLNYSKDYLKVTTVDKCNRQSGSFLDSEKRLVKNVDRAGNITTYEYDKTLASPQSSHLPTRIVYPTFTRKYTYDNMHRCISTSDIIDENNVRTVSVAYNSRGDVSFETDEEGYSTAYEYDELGRVVKVIDSLGGVTSRTYDDRSNLLSVTDPEGGVIRFAYDRLNRLIQETRPLGQVTAYEYDSVGNLISVVDNKGQKIIYSYNAANLKTRAQYFAADNGSAPVRTVDFTYDELLNLTGWSDGYFSGTFTYDALKRKTSETVHYGSFDLTYLYEYYPDGAKKSFTGPDGVKVEYAYDSGARLTGISIPDAGTVTYQDHKWNAPQVVGYPGGAEFRIGYDPAMRITDLGYKSQAGDVNFSRNYGHSPKGNILSIDSEIGSFSYEYDHDRLKTANNAVVDNEAYTYDKLNNRVTSLALNGTWTYNADNQLISADSLSFEYGPNGNTIRKSRSGLDVYFRYDILDRLVSIDDGQGTTLASYEYDPFNRRLSKTVMGQKTFYFYTNEGLTAELNEDGEFLRSYGWAPDSNFGTDPIWLKEDGSFYWYQNDHRGVPWKLTATDGRVVWEGAYNSFGLCTVLTDTITNNLRYPGQYYDYESGLHYNLNRYYDPETGRYLQLDPAHDGINGYTYVYGNPLAMVDPHGLCAVRALAGAGAIATGIGAFAAACTPVGLLGAGILTMYGVHEEFAGITGLAGGGNFDMIGDGWDAALPNNPYLAAAATFATHALIPISAGALINAGLCFAKGTPVLTKDGTKPIQDLEVGELVASYNDRTGKIDWRRITRLFRRQKQKVIELTIANEDGETETLIVTPKHPFREVTGDEKWTAASKLEPGDILKSFDGRQITVVSIEALKSPIDVYNMEVDEDHTYFVGVGGVCVHNVCSVAEASNKLKKAVNSNLDHAAKRGTKRKIFKSLSEAKSKLRQLTKQLTKNGNFPAGTLADTAHSDRVLVPVGDGGFAVYQLAKNGTAKLKTILIAK